MSDPFPMAVSDLELESGFPQVRPVTKSPQDTQCPVSVCIQCFPSSSDLAGGSLRIKLLFSPPSLYGTEPDLQKRIAFLVSSRLGFSALFGFYLFPQPYKVIVHRCLVASKLQGVCFVSAAKWRRPLPAINRPRFLIDSWARRLTLGAVGEAAAGRGSDPQARRAAGWLCRQESHRMRLDQRTPA